MVSHAESSILDRDFLWERETVHSHWMPLGISLHDAYHSLLEAGIEYSVLLNEDRTVHAMVSFRRISAVLSARYGPALYSHSQVMKLEVPMKFINFAERHSPWEKSSVVVPKEHLLVIRQGNDFLTAEKKFRQRRPELYFDDLVIVDERQHYLGLLSAQKFTLIHSQFTKAQEQRLAQQNRLLQDTLEDLSRTQAELVTKAKMASLGELIAGIAHEMNTPLGVLLSAQEVIGIAQTRLAGENDAARRSDLQNLIEQNKSRAMAATGSVTKIINSLKVFGRNQAEVMHPANLSKLVDNALTLLANQFRSGIKVRVEHPETVNINCFSDQIGQVLLNILNNAYQAMDGQGEIEVLVDTEGRDAVVTLRDHGPGIPADLLDRIFDPGYTTKGVGVGTGLGLSISRKIIEENHGGKLTVRNHPDGGAVFQIRLPLIELTAKTQQSKEKITV
ncbi:MAG: ATP-binding protein [Verrucomicrobiae bacterium]|nr:ATP-binding protein [Verrucomicrobiae bacterium]